MRSYVGRVRRQLRESWLLHTNSSYKLNHRGQGIVNFIDVGAIDGLPDPWKSNANLVKFVLNFEPNESPSRGPNHLTYNTAVWESEDTLPFFIYKGFRATGSSLFEQNFEYVRAHFETLRSRGPVHLSETWFDRSELVETKQLRCRPLDHILRDELPHIPFHFLKIDAQGAEYQILKGASTLLSGSCAGLFLELFTVPLYKNIALLDEVVAFVADFGFSLVKKFPPHGSFDSQHDCLFLKDGADPAICRVIRNVYGLSHS